MLSVDGEGYKADGKARYVSPDLLTDDEESSGMWTIFASRLHFVDTL